MWEGVGDQTELQHNDPPHSIGHKCVSFRFSWAAQPGGWGPSLSRCWFSLSQLYSNWSDSQLTDFLSLPGLYNNLSSTLLPASVTISHSFNPSMVKVIISWYSSTGCTCYLHRCISYFDSLAGSEVNMQQQSWWWFIRTETLQCRLCFLINLSFYLDYFVINFSLYIYMYVYAIIKNPVFFSLYSKYHIFTILGCYLW